MVEVKKKEGETAESLLRRFSRKVQQSGILIQAKKKKFYESPKSKREIKEVAMRKKQIKERREFLKKIGKLNEQPGVRMKLSRLKRIK